MQNLHKKILIILFAATVLILPAVSFIAMPRPEPAFSENENRFLAQLEKPSISNLTNRRFMNSLDSWFADRFVLRENWIILQNELEMLQGKTEINETFIIGDRLIQVWRGQPDIVNNNVLETADRFALEMNRRYNIESHIMLIPSSQEIYKDTLPPNSRPGNQAALIKHCYDNLPNLGNIDVMTYLAENSDSYIYYRTDHHWTTYGAYWGYYASAQKLGFTPYDVGWFDVRHASSDFRGTLYSKTLNSKITPDVISFYTPSNNPPKITLTINDGETITEHDSFYFPEYLDTKDKYAAFMGQNSAVMDVVTDVGNDKSLLIIKDSFAHCMIPFLANHYSRITVLDMRYINVDIGEYADLNEYEQILFVFNAPNFAEDTALRKLEETM